MSPSFSGRTVSLESSGQRRAITDIRFDNIAYFYILREDRTGRNRMHQFHTDMNAMYHFVCIRAK